jgi:glycosyltransferase involved in cell wall biosynthesis
MTSFNEGTPVSLIEAQAACKPVISTDVGGVSDILSMDCGYLIEKENESNFLNKLLKLIEDNELRTNMGKNGWLSVGQKFHYNQLVENTRNLYHQLL